MKKTEPKLNRPLNVAHIFTTLGTGGMEKVATDVIKNFNPRKVQPYVYCIAQEGKYADELKARGIIVRTLERYHMPFIDIYYLLRVFKKDKIDIVHSHSGVYRDAVISGKLAGVKVIVHTDHGRFYPDLKWTRFNYRFFSRFRDRIITVSDELREFFIRDLGINPNIINRIYNGVDLKKYSTAMDIEVKKKELGIPGDYKVLGIVARLTDVKNHVYLINAFKEIKKRHQNVVLLVIGDGPLGAYLRETTEALSLTEDVWFLGDRRDVPELLQIIDIACLSSKHEGLSITLLEAMAAGRPVVATSVGGNPELVRDGVNGFLVPLNNHKKMAERVIRLLDDEILRKNMGSAGRKRVKEEFSIKDNALKYEDLYFEIASLKGVA